MATVTIHTAKTTLSQLLARVEAGEGIIVARLDGTILRGALPGPHRDPFARMSVVQAMLEDLVLGSNEQPFDA